MAAVATIPGRGAADAFAPSLILTTIFPNNTKQTIRSVSLQRSPRASGATRFVSPKLDWVEVALQTAKSNIAQLSAWLESGQIGLLWQDGCGAQEVAGKFPVLSPTGC